MLSRGQRRFDGVRRPNFDFHTACTVRVGAAAIRRPKIFRVQDTAATLDDIREAITTLEDIERIARRVLGGAHPLVAQIGPSLRTARAALAAREGDVESLREAVEAMTPGNA